MIFNFLLFCAFTALAYAWSPGSKFPCPEDTEILSPCQCSVVSFDSVTYYSQISCSGVNGKQLKNIFSRAFNRQNVPTEYDILEVKDVPMLNICCEDILEGFSFKTIKFIDSKLCAIHLNALISTHEVTKELVFVDVRLTSNLVNGQQLFRVVRNFVNLKGFYMLTSNLEQIPQDAFQSDDNDFGKNLEVIRVCNTQVSKLYDNTFNNLPQLLWIDFGDNKIDHVTSNVFRTNSFISRPLEISLSGNKLSSGSIEKGAFDNITREVKIYLNANNLQLLEEDVFDQLLRRHNYEIHVEENPFICDCRHRWLFNRKEEYIYRLKDMNCEDTRSIWVANLPNLCDRSRYILETQPNGEVFRKCCRKIRYNRDFGDFQKEVIQISQPPNQQVVQKYTNFPKHEDIQQVVQTQQKKTSEPVITQQIYVPPAPVIKLVEQKITQVQKQVPIVHYEQQVKQVTTAPRLVQKTEVSQQKLISPAAKLQKQKQTVVTPAPQILQHYQNIEHTTLLKSRDEQQVVTAQKIKEFEQKPAWPQPQNDQQVVTAQKIKEFEQKPAWLQPQNDQQVVTAQKIKEFEQKPAWLQPQNDQQVVTAQKIKEFEQKPAWPQPQNDQQVVTAQKIKEFVQKPAWPQPKNDQQVVTAQKIKEFVQKPAWPQPQNDQQVVTAQKIKEFEQKPVWPQPQVSQLTVNSQRAPEVDQKPTWTHPQFDQHTINSPKAPDFDQKPAWSNDQQSVTNTQNLQPVLSWHRPESNFQNSFHFMTPSSASDRTFNQHFPSYPRPISSFESHYPREIEEEEEEDDDEGFQS